MSQTPSNSSDEGESKLSDNSSITPSKDWDAKDDSSMMKNTVADKGGNGKPWTAEEDQLLLDYLLAMKGEGCARDRC